MLPGGCLSTLHCLILPQEELYAPPSDPTNRLSLRHGDQACSVVGEMLLDVNMAAISGCKGDRGGRKGDGTPCDCSPSVSPSVRKSPRGDSSHRGRWLGSQDTHVHRTQFGLTTMWVSQNV